MGTPNLRNPLPVLRRFDIFVYKNKNGYVDRSQIPCTADDATINFYRQGATLSSDIDIPQFGSAEIPVYHTGALKDSDSAMLVIGAGFAPVHVDSVDATSNTITVHNLSGFAISPPRGTRLLPTSVLGLVFPDPMGRGTAVTQLAPHPDGSGRVTGYVRDYLSDYVVTVPDDVEPVRLFIDGVGSFVMRG